MSRRLEAIKVVNLEEGKPTVERARLRMEHELHEARRAGYKAVKLIHGYGSSGASTPARAKAARSGDPGAGGALRTELQRALRQAARDGAIRTLIAGEDWRVSDETTWNLLQRFPEWKRDSDLGRNNRGISVVVL